MIRNAHDQNPTDEATQERSLWRRLNETDEMVRLAERLCQNDPNSFAYQLQLRGLQAHRASLWEELCRFRNGEGVGNQPMS